MSMRIAHRKCGTTYKVAKVEKLNRSLRSVLAGAMALVVVAMLGVATAAVVDDGSRANDLDRKDITLAQNTPQGQEKKPPVINLPTGDKKPDIKLPTDKTPPG